jgi:hypothetical protein
MLELVKLLLNSVLSRKGAWFSTIDRKTFYLTLLCLIQNMFASSSLISRTNSSRSAMSIQVEEMGGAIAKHNTRKPVKQTIFSEIHNKQFTMAGKAPICNGKLFQEFGYTANTEAAWAVLDGT